MNIVVVLRQVPDLVEPLDIDASGAALNWDALSYILNECDEHALEQGLLLKEAGDSTLTVVGLSGADIENSLFAAAAKGADRLVKISCDLDRPPSPQVAAALYAAAIEPWSADLVLVGVQAHNELEGVLAPQLAAALDRPYVGVIRGVQATSAGSVTVCKEFPGAIMAKLNVRLPAVLGILGADQPPRYVPVSRLRAAIKNTPMEEAAGIAPQWESKVSIRKLSPPISGTRAEMLGGEADEVADRIAVLLAEKGLLK
ncbi:MAG: electron transfer flavoprotein subunit beta/FixA family protein [Pirellulaceae bacterium]